MVKVGDAGLDISILLPFRFLHPPLLIPWAAIESCREKKLWMSTQAFVRVAKLKKQLTFTGKLATEILAHCPTTSHETI